MGLKLHPYLTQETATCANRVTGNGSPELGLDKDDDMDFINDLPGHSIVPNDGQASMAGSR